VTTTLELVPKIPCRQVADIELPGEIDGLYDLAYNLWWSWTREARQLFSSIDSDAWARYRNPVEVLVNVDRVHLERLVENSTFMDSYVGVQRAFRGYLEGQNDTWFRRRFPDYAAGPFAYFSMEYGIATCLRVYSGGLGVLSGDHCKTASDLGLPFVALGLLYRAGYFRQAIDADGFQQHIYPEYDFTRLPVRPAMDSRGRDVIIQVPLPGREVAAKVWVAQVGRVPILLLDTDVPANDPADRPIANVLYVRGREMRLVQEIVLGIGGVRALAALGIEPSMWHINEGHSALLQLERLREAIATQDIDFEAALDLIKANTSFTTHTPVPAGNEQFDQGMMAEYLEPWVGPLRTDMGRLMALGSADHGEPGQPMNLTALALRSSSYANAVSRLNAEVSDNMWRHLFPGQPPEEPVIEPITNGVHLPTWLGTEIRALFRKRYGTDWFDALMEPAAWDFIEEIPDEELWAAHTAQKERLIRFSRSRLLEQYARHGRSPGDLRAVANLFDPAALTIGFARRFATYKRAGLVFSDLHRLRQILCHLEQPVQIIMAGKAHPADRPGQELIQHIYKLSQEPDLHGRVAFLENYDMRMGGMLVQGVDVWLNTPRKPLEASGTSGQKAAVNGVLNFSILDGWWPEGYDGENGWAIGEDAGSLEEWQQDQQDANSLYSTLEEGVIPTFYQRQDGGCPKQWVAMMKRSMVTIGPRFSASRMVREYAERAYVPLAGFRRD
jgi:starch phosphorylase